MMHDIAPQFYIAFLTIRSRILSNGSSSASQVERHIFSFFSATLKLFGFSVSITNMKTTRSYRQSNRARSAAETGGRIIQAFLARLRLQWFDEITLDQVAEDAGVTVQTVIRRFGGKAGLLEKAVHAMKQDAKERRATPPGDLDQLVKNLCDEYEERGNTVSRLLATEERHAVVHELLTLARGWHRNWVSRVFADDLQKLTGKERQAVLDALVIATDVYTWKLLRRDMGRSVAATRAVMKGMIRATLAGSSS